MHKAKGVKIGAVPQEIGGHLSAGAGQIDAGQRMRAPGDAQIQQGQGAILQRGQQGCVRVWGIVAGGQIKGDAAPVQARRGQGRDGGRGGGACDLDQQGGGGLAVLEAVSLGRAGIPGVGGDAKLAMPVAKAKIGKTRTAGTVGGDDGRAALLAAVKVGHRAMRKTDAQRLAGGGGVEPVGQIAAGVTLGRGGGQKGRAGAQGVGRRGQQHGHIRGGVLDHLAPQFGRAGMVVVAGHQHPVHVVCRAHRVHGLTDHRGRGRGLIKGVARQQDVAGALGTRQCGQMRQGIRAGLTQAHADILGEAPEGFAQVQVRRMDKPDHAVVAQMGRRPPIRLTGARAKEKP